MITVKLNIPNWQQRKQLIDHVRNIKDVLCLELGSALIIQFPIFMTETVFYQTEKDKNEPRSLVEVGSQGVELQELNQFDYSAIKERFFL
ncbi:hypothetical protein GNP80_08930 [Aliivibrio fischeri]|uniref:hypothetical protein n=1 Tax=Aliivibrio fischeri TaxID=668 RepID=UPI0012D9BA48|nr:hypothetical protein [Aliivibrio fischeri]MUK92565.1 hypothetical protein [Aliivibrio fischeri]